jgi:hypothetical protein
MRPTGRAYQNHNAENSTISGADSVDFSLSREDRHALAAWVRAKQTLERVMRREDFQAFVRPMYLTALFDRCFLLLAMPPNQRLFQRAWNFRPNLATAIELQNYHLAGIARYPTDDELLMLKDKPAFAPFVALIWRKRMDKAIARRPAEDDRDCSDLSRELARDSERMVVGVRP